MLKTQSVYLAEDQIKQLISMVENASFKGSNAFQVLSLLENLKEGLKDETIDNHNKNNSR